jgi:hypothetical protein
MKNEIQRLKKKKKNNKNKDMITSKLKSSFNEIFHFINNSDINISIKFLVQVQFFFVEIFKVNDNAYRNRCNNSQKSSLLAR